MKNRGITLISLVITIIVMLIIAGVAILAILGENGLLDKVVYAKFATEVKSIEEQVKLKQMMLDSYYNGSINDFLQINSNYDSKVLIEEGALKYIATKSSYKEIEWFEKLGISKASDYYSVKFDTLGANEEIPSQNVRVGKTANQPINPKKEGYEFLGWYYIEEEGTENNVSYKEIEFDFNTVVTKNYSLYAKYKGEAVMMAYNETLPFWQEEYRKKITNIKFIKGDIIIPDDAIISCNVEENSDCGEIIAYIENNINEAEYILTFVSPYTIYANANSRGYFMNFTNLKEIYFENIDFSKTLIMAYMFSGCSNIENLDLSSFKTDNVINMQNMFYGCSNLKELDLTNFNTTKVSSMGSMFKQCTSLEKLNIDSFNTGNVDTMYSMFWNCNSLEKLNLTNFDTSKVMNMSEMFGYNSSLKELDLSNFDTSKVKDMSKMFRNCNNLININLSSFDTENVTSMEEMFSSCSNIENLDLSNFNTSKVKNMKNMFITCAKLKNLNVSSFDTSNVENMCQMFRNCWSIENLDVKNFNTSNVIDASHMFWNCNKLKELNLTNWSFENIEQYENMFRNSIDLTVYVKDENEASKVHTINEIISIYYYKENQFVKYEG